ncbi:uncharacterized protein LOC143372999 [Andrena cerasifolii]|uniref:uncharacterized protein LOC143372999 n=1 Tax=Andrena cerasifolii TaxID=2819439 RepID=UPI004037DFF1
MYLCFYGSFVTPLVTARVSRLCSVLSTTSITLCVHRHQVWIWLKLEWYFRRMLRLSEVNDESDFNARLLNHNRVQNLFVNWSFRSTRYMYNASAAAEHVRGSPADNSTTTSDTCAETIFKRGLIRLS